MARIISDENVLAAILPPVAVLTDEFVAEISEEFEAMLPDYADVAELIAHAVGSRAGLPCSVRLADDRGRLGAATVAGGPAGDCAYLADLLAETLPSPEDRVLEHTLMHTPITHVDFRSIDGQPFADSARTRMAKSAGIHAVLMAALTDNGRLLGAISLARLRPPSPFVPEDGPRLLQIAHVASRLVARSLARTAAA